MITLKLSQVGFDTKKDNKDLTTIISLLNILKREGWIISLRDIYLEKK